MTLLYVFISSFVGSLLLTPAMIKVSYKFNILKPARSDHGKPCMGGAGIYAAFLAAILSSMFFIRLPGVNIGAVVLSSSIIILLGLIDDIKDIRPLFKILGESAGILILLAFGFFTKIAFLPVWVNILVTGAWFLFITNAFNLLDIMDGLTSGLVIIISSGLFIIAFVNKDNFSCVILAGLIGAHLGFLKYNYPPAKIYMGDTGSLFSGFLLAMTAINISYASIDRKIALFTPILIMSLPIYDTLFLMIMRIKKKKPIFNKTRDHFALRLMTMGYSIKKSVWIMYLFNVFLVLLALVVAFSKNSIGFIAILVMAFVFILMGKKIGMVNIED